MEDAAQVETPSSRCACKSRAWRELCARPSELAGEAAFQEASPFLSLHFLAFVAHHLGESADSACRVAPHVTFGFIST